MFFLNSSIFSEVAFCQNQDVQDVFFKFIYIFRSCFLSESGCAGFEDVQDGFLIFLYIFRNCTNSNTPEYRTQI